jgi:hypothetical protein
MIDGHGHVAVKEHHDVIFSSADCGVFDCPRFVDP